MVIDPRFLLDTNVCIRILAGTAPGATAWLSGLAVGTAAVSAISFGEFVRGYLRQRNLEPHKRPALKVVMPFFEQVPVLSFDRMAAARLADIPLDRSNLVDGFIAAHALALNAVLVTDDRRFPTAQKLKLRQLADVEAEFAAP
jgi:tRNA(fMet)-specific endonuclease VapC